MTTQTPDTHPAHDHSDDAARMLRLLARQRDAMERLARVSEGQAAIIARGDVEALLALIEQRRPIVDELAALAHDATPYRERWAHLLASADDAHREQLTGLAREVEDMRGMLVDRDARDRAEMETARDALASDIAGMSRGRGVHAAYAPAREPSNDTRYQDTQG